MANLPDPPDDEVDYGDDEDRDYTKSPSSRASEPPADGNSSDGRRLADYGSFGHRAQAWPSVDSRPAPVYLPGNASAAGARQSPAAEFSSVRPALKETSPIPTPSSQCGIGIVGPSNSGKTYLFQSLVYRLENPGQYGVMTRYLKKNGIALYECSKPSNTGHDWDLAKYSVWFRHWSKLQATPPGIGFWFYLLLTVRAGWLGFAESTFKVTFIDCAGEEYQSELDLSDEDSPDRKLSTTVWLTFERARVMVFCLPAWVVFPGNTMSESDWRVRASMMEGFSQVLSNYRKLRRERRAKHGPLPKTRIVVALTHADDSRCGLTTLRERWIDAYISESDANLERLSKISGPTTYLAAARAVSDYVRHEFRRSPDQEIKSLPGLLEIDGERPWFIPMTAMNGATLTSINRGQSRAAEPPVPAHVELPLLLALCDEHNMLM
jgi:hypothetical protein